jgi:NADP-dependent 3-hydroxy acid dehydrogenase YdfG
MSELGGKVAVVTGAGSGIGRAVSLRLAADGAVVCLVGRRSEHLTAVARGAECAGGRCVSYPMDIAVDSDIAGLRDHVEREFGALDILIHSAGVITLGRFDKARVEDLDWQYRVNVRGASMLTCSLLPMLKARRGQIVFMNSSVGLTARAGAGHYAASKHALRAIADSLRDEVNADGIRVLSVFLGRTASQMQSEIHRAEGRPYKPEHLIQPEDVASVVVNALTVPRTAEVTEIRMRPMRKPD